MLPPPTTSRLIRFGPFEVDHKTRELFSHGKRVPLQDKPFHILAVLLEHRGDIVTREELRHLWPDDTFVDLDQGVNKAIKKIREALGDSADNPRYVETLHRRGYRFIYPVDSVAAMSSSPSPLTVAAAVRDHRYGARWIALTAAAVVVAVLAALVARNLAGLRDRLLAATRAGHADPPRIESIAVLPLENLSGDPEQEYFADGMTEALITNLGKVSTLRVISRTSVMRYKGTKKPLPRIARELKVDLVVEGSVQRSGNRVRIAANLLHAPTDRHLWAETYERDLRDVLTLQSDVAQAIAREVQIKVTPQVQSRLASIRTVNPEAHEAYLRGRYAWNKRTEEGLREALVLFGESVEKDPRFAPAYAGLADTYVTLGDDGFLPPRDAFPKAKEAANKALELDDALAEGHVSLGAVKFYYDWDWPGAESEFKRAIELNADHAVTHQLYSLVLMVTGRIEEGLAEISAAQRLNPVSPSIGADVGWRLYLRRQYDRAIAECEKTLRLEPDYAPAHNRLGLVYEQKGMMRRAISEHQKASELSRGSVYASADLARVYAMVGKQSEARKILRDLGQRTRQSYVLPFDLALIHLGLDEKDQALELLEKAVDDRNGDLVFLKLDPRFDSLRSEPRFQDLLRRMNFPE